MFKKILFSVLTALSFTIAMAVVNINTATEPELRTLKGIGEKKAADIAEYRKKNGPFKTIDDLAKVSGIGKKTIEKLKDEITVGNEKIVKTNPKPATQPQQKQTKINSK